MTTTCDIHADQQVFTSPAGVSAADVAAAKGLIGQMVEERIRQLLDPSVVYWPRQDVLEAFALRAAFVELGLEQAEPAIRRAVTAASNFIRQQEQRQASPSGNGHHPGARIPTEVIDPSGPASAAPAAAIDDKVASPLEEKARRLSEFFNGEVVVDDVSGPAPAAPGPAAPAAIPHEEEAADRALFHKVFSGPTLSTSAAPEPAPVDPLAVAALLAQHPPLAAPDSPYHRRPLKEWSAILGWDLLPEDRAIAIRYRKATGQEPPVCRNRFGYSALELQLIGVSTVPVGDQASQPHA
jgi:hypothetical protein